MKSQSRSHKSTAGGRSGRKGGQNPSSESGLRDTKEFPLVHIATPTKIHFSVPKRIDPFPQRYRTVLTTAFRGTVPTTVSTMQAYCRLNSVLIPFSGGGWPGSVPAISTLRPVGYDRLLSIYAYRLFRVIASRIVVEVTPVADVDTVLVTVTPTTSSSNPPGAAEAMSTELSTFKQITRGQPASSNRVINKCSQATLMGVRPQAIQDDLSGAFTGAYNVQPSAPLYWVVWIQNLNSANFNTGVTYTVRLEHDVECWGDTQATDPPMFDDVPHFHEDIRGTAALGEALARHNTSTPVDSTQVGSILTPEKVRESLGKSSTPTSQLLLKAYERALAKEATRTAEQSVDW